MESTETGLTVIDGAVSVTAMVQQQSLIQEYMAKILKPDHHYGVIPGCGDKPTLLKPGAEKLMFAFNLRCEFDIETTALTGGHKEVRVVAHIINKDTGAEVGQGVGEGSTRESKWLYRTGVNEPTEFKVPKEYWNDRDIDILRDVDPELMGLPLSTVKVDGVWFIAVKGEKVEHDNPADYLNTVLKMTKKRAMVDGVITVTACSDIFTQDIEEMKDNGKAAQGKPPKSSSQPKGEGEGEGEGEGDTIGDKKGKYVYALFMDAGYTSKEVGPKLKEFCGASYTSKVPKDRLAELEAGLKARAEKNKELANA